MERKPANCWGCGQYFAHGWLDHTMRGCQERGSGESCDSQGGPCTSEDFCSERCADRFHGGGAKS
jgi:hypothetical protein